MVTRIIIPLKTASEWYFNIHNCNISLYSQHIPLFTTYPFIHFFFTDIAILLIIITITLFKSLDIDKSEWLEDIKHGDSSSASFMASVEECERK